MTAFVLVHGSGQNARSWSRVADLLVARGHSVVAPELPKRAPGWGLRDYAARIAASVGGADTIVVAHSLSGVFLPLIPPIRTCGMLVFVAAVIPEPRKSVRQQFREDPSMFSPAWIQSGPRWFDKSQARDLAKEFLFHDCDAATLPWALDTLDYLENQALVTELLPCASWPDLAAASIVPLGDRTLSPDWCKRVTRARLKRNAIEVDGGHCPHVSRPAEIASILDDLARRPSG